MNYYDNFYEGLNDSRNLLYRQIDTVSTMNKLSSTLCCEIQNLKNYKINIKGKDSYLIKLQLNRNIENLNYFTDQIQKLIKIKNGFPIFQLNDIENISLIKTLTSIDFKEATVSNNIKSEYKILKNLVIETINNAKKEDDIVTINLLSDLLYIIDDTLQNYEL